MTLNGYFTLIFAFAAVDLEPLSSTFENNSVKNTDPCYPQQKCGSGTLVSGSIRFMQIFTGVLCSSVTFYGCNYRNLRLSSLKPTSDEPAAIGGLHKTLPKML